MPAHDHQTIHEYGYFFNGLLLQFPFRFADISGYNDEFTDGGQQFIRQAAQVGTTIRLNLVPHRAIFCLKVQLQLAPPNGHKAGNKLPEVGFIILKTKRAREREGFSLSLSGII